MAAANAPNDSLTSSNFWPPSPTPDDHHPTVIFVVFISFGSLLFLCACLSGIWWVLQRRHRKRKLVQKTEDIDVDEHRRVQEMVVPGRHGPARVVFSDEAGIRIHDKVEKNEIDGVGSKGLHGHHGSSGSTSQLQLSHAEERV